VHKISDTQQTYVEHGPEAISRHLVTSTRLSFEASQGDQACQVHVAQFVVKQAREQGETEPDQETIGRLRRRGDSLRLPQGHKPVDAKLKAAQFLLWGEIFLDIIAANYGHDADSLPSADQLADRVELLGNELDIDDIWGMSSFQPDEMRNMDTALEPYRNDPMQRLASADVMAGLLLPKLIEVELKWQQNGRPGDKDDPFMSVLGHASGVARAKKQNGKPLTAYNLLYLGAADHLETLGSDDPLEGKYRKLVEAFNTNHKGEEPVPSLHATSESM
jgi:hypothetical protein